MAVRLAAGALALRAGSGSFVLGFCPWLGVVPGRFSGPVACLGGTGTAAFTGAGLRFRTCAVLGRGSNDMSASENRVGDVYFSVYDSPKYIQFVDTLRQLIVS